MLAIDGLIKRAVVCQISIDNLDLTIIIKPDPDITMDHMSLCPSVPVEILKACMPPLNLEPSSLNL